MQIRRPFVGSLCSAVVVGALLTVSTQPPGPGIDPDALAYVGAAQWVAHTGQYRIPSSGWTGVDSTAPLEHFPPAFSTVVAVPILAGATPLQAGRLVVITAGALSAALVFAIVAGAVGLGWAALAVVVVFSTPAVLCQYLSLLSEPLYIVFLLTSVAAFVKLRERFEGTVDPPALPSLRRTTRWAILAFALSAAAAVMTRYAGAPIVALGVLYVFTRPTRWTYKLRVACLIVLPTAVALVLWITQGVHSAKNIRHFQLNSGVGATLLRAFGTLRDAIIPGTGGFLWRSIAAVGGVIILAVLLGYAWRRPASDRVRTVLASIGWIVVGCAAMLIVSRIIADPGIPGDERIMSPLIVLGEVAVIVAIASLWRGWTRGPRLVAVLVMLGWIAPSASLCQNRVSDLLEFGSDLASDEWRNSPLVAWVRANGSGHTLYTNWPAVLYFQAGRATHTLPDVDDALNLRRFRDRLLRQHGLVIAFSTPSQDYVSPDSVAVHLQLHVVARLADGTVWSVPTDSTATVQRGR